jgi:hypothetical protein
MDSPDTLPRALIVTSNIVIAEDLTDILRDHRGATVDARTSLQDDWGADYELAVFDTPLDQLMGDRRLGDLAKAGTRLIVLEGFSGAARAAEGLSVLAQPFRTADVVALLESLGLARKC